MPIVFYKKTGETPLEALDRLRKEQTQYKYSVLSYAGRLDPLAEGLLLVLIDEECKEKEKYLSLDKEYEATILWGYATDTYDILGKITRVSDAYMPKDKVQEKIKKIVGKQMQKYPPYSSKTVDGTPLFQWAREGRLSEIQEMPKQEIEIYAAEVLDTKEIKASELLKNILFKISEVQGDFRQKEIASIWRENLENKEEKYTMLRIRIACSSGTYIRSLTQEFGESVQQSACLYALKRTKVAQYSL